MNLKIRSLILRRFFMMVGLLLFCNLPISNAEVLEPTQGLWITFEVGVETFQAVVTNPQAMQYALDAFGRANYPEIDFQFPVGKIQRGGDYNPQWSWHLEPETISFYGMSTELCDGRPSDIENNFEYWHNSVKQYCPWSAVIKAIKDCRSGKCTTLHKATHP